MSGLYGAVGGVNREIKKLYGSVNGVNREIKELWAAKDGVNRKIFSSGIRWNYSVSLDNASYWSSADMTSWGIQTVTALASAQYKTAIIIVNFDSPILLYGGKDSAGHSSISFNQISYYGSSQITQDGNGDYGIRVNGNDSYRYFEDICYGSFQATLPSDIEVSKLEFYITIGNFLTNVKTQLTPHVCTKDGKVFDLTNLGEFDG